MAPKPPRFLADAMLGSVARKLRIFGFDTLYIADSDDEVILKTGIDQGRVILTADKELFRRAVKAGSVSVLVDCKSDLEDLVHILAKNGIRSVGSDGIGTRCSICNGLLEETGLVTDLPKRVRENHSQFYQCKACGKTYWYGSHLKRIREFARNLDVRLANAATT